MASRDTLSRNNGESIPMTISQETERRAGPFLSDGAQTAFPFTFKLLDASHIQVLVSPDGLEDSVLDSKYYSVTLAAEQDSSPGGTVYLQSPQPAGTYLSILSAVPYTQPLNLTSRGGFYPDVINDAFDRCVTQIQQLKEIIDRQLTVPATSEKTSQQVLSEVLDIAASANEFAAKAELTYQSVLATKALVEETRVHIDKQKGLVDLAEAEVEEDRQEVSQMLADAQKVNETTEQFLPYVNELVEVVHSIEDVRVVASELQGLPIESMDLGRITDAATPVYDSKESNIEKLASNIDLLQLVVDNIDAIQTAVNAAHRAEAAAVSAESFAGEAEETVERVKEIESTDFEKIYEQGVN